MKSKTLSSALSAIVLAAMQSPAYAADTGIEWLKISGFGTLASTRANIDKSSGAYFAPSMTAAKGAQDSWDGGVDSKLGVQVSALIIPTLSATVQVIERRDYEANYRPTAEWANLKYAITPDIAVRVGRVGLPAFLISDYVYVGYSQPWIRPPLDAYKEMPMTHVDGMDAIFRFHAGNSIISVQPAFGQSKFTYPLYGVVSEWKVKNIVAANVIVENGPWTARYGNVRSHSESRALPAPLEDNFNELGLIYEKGAWLVQGEYIWRTSNKMAGRAELNQKMGYATVGYRLGSVMPNITFSRYLDQTTTGTSGTTENTVSTGVRWDFYKNVALKAQWDHITRPSSRTRTLGPGAPDIGYTGLFNATSFGTAFSKNNKTINVLAVALDFVF